jgi:hypothetical protein
VVVTTSISATPPRCAVTRRPARRSASSPPAARAGSRVPPSQPASATHEQGAGVCEAVSSGEQTQRGAVRSFVLWRCAMVMVFSMCNGMRWNWAVLSEPPTARTPHTTDPSTVIPASPSFTHTCLMPMQQPSQLQYYRCEQSIPLQTPHRRTPEAQSDTPQLSSLRDARAICLAAHAPARRPWSPDDLQCR